MTTKTTPNTPCADPKPFGGDKGHASYFENQTSARHKGGYVCQTHCCCYCGKKALTTKFHAFLLDEGKFAAQEDHADEDYHLGFYPLGSDCARKLKKVGVPVYKVTNNNVERA